MNLPKTIRVTRKPIPSKMPFLDMRVETFKLVQFVENFQQFREESRKEIKRALDNVNLLATKTSEALDEVKKISLKVDAEFDSMTKEIVEVLQEIKQTGLKGDVGESGKDGKDAIIPDIEQIAELASSKVKPTPASLKIIKESVELRDEDIVPKLNKASNLDDLKLSIANIKDWDKKWNDIKGEISRSKQGFHGGGFNNILDGSGTVSTGLDNLKFTGSGVSSVSQSGRTVTVDISGGGGGFTVLPATGTIDDTNVTFTFTSAPTLININGSFYSDTSTVGGTLVWTIVGLIVTLAFPVGDGGTVYGIA